MVNERKLEVGDRVTVLPTSYLKKYIGTSGVISKFDEDGDPLVLMDIDGHNTRFYACNVKKEEQKMTFSVGQKVTVVGQQYEYMNSIGNTGVITKARLEGDHPYQIDNRWWYNADELKEVKGMQKSDLKTGMMVQTADNIWWAVILDSSSKCQQKPILMTAAGGWNPLDLYDDNLEYVGEFPGASTIQKVATCDYLTSFFSRTPVEELTGFKVIWQRENPKKQQLTELVDKLREQLKDATDELETM